MLSLGHVKEWDGTCAIIFMHTDQLSRYVLHKCCRHKCNSTLTTSGISCTCEIMWACVMSVVSVVTVPLDTTNALCHNSVWYFEYMYIFVMSVMMPYIVTQCLSNSTYYSKGLFFYLQTPALHHYTTYSKENIMPCVHKLACLVSGMDTCKQQAVRTKYSSSKFMKVSKTGELKGDIIRFLSSSK